MLVSSRFYFPLLIAGGGPPAGEYPGALAAPPKCFTPACIQRGYGFKAVKQISAKG